MQHTEILVPLKAFSAAKSRLRTSFHDTQRIAIIKKMAATVFAAARNTPVSVVSDDRHVHQWVKEFGVGLIDPPAGGLNEAIQHAFTLKSAEGVDRVVIVHGDLPRASNFCDYDQIVGVAIVTDWANNGTKLLSVPTKPGFAFRYGTGSAAAHRFEASRRGVSAETFTDRRLSLDINTYDDLIRLRDEDPMTYAGLLDKAERVER